jgi:hypothetical protein
MFTFRPARRSRAGACGLPRSDTRRAGLDIGDATFSFPDVTSTRVPCPPRTLDPRLATAAINTRPQP